MNHLNEYRLFKGSRNTWRPKLDTPEELSKHGYDTPYYRSSWDSGNEKNPEEPFFIGAKRRWKQEKQDEFKKKAKELNAPIIKTELLKMGITDEMADKLRTLGSIDPPRLSKDDQYYYLSVGAGEDNDAIINIKYFIPEKDYVFASIDYNGKWLRKKFENPQEGIDWLISIKANKNITRRQQLRQVDESNEPGIDVFNLKGIDKKLNNLITFDDFEKTFKSKEQKSTKRTDVGLDILNERKTKK